MDVGAALPLCSRIAVHNRALELRLRTEAQYREAAEAPKGAHTVNFIEGQQKLPKEFVVR